MCTSGKNSQYLEAIFLCISLLSHNTELENTEYRITDTLFQDGLRPVFPSPSVPAPVAPRGRGWRQAQGQWQVVP